MIFGAADCESRAAPVRAESSAISSLARVSMP